MRSDLVLSKHPTLLRKSIKGNCCSLNATKNKYRWFPLHRNFPQASMHEFKLLLLELMLTLTLIIMQNSISHSSLNGVTSAISANITSFYVLISVASYFLITKLLDFISIPVTVLSIVFLLEYSLWANYCDLEIKIFLLLEN